MEEYRSGHNGPHSKCGSPKGLVGSNPTSSAKKYRDVAQLGSALRSGHGTIQFIKYPPNSHKPFNTAIYGDLKNKIHVVKSVLTTCYPTDTGDIEK